MLFTILKAPTITSLSVSQGKPLDIVVVTGTNLMGFKKPAVVFGNKTSAALVGSTQTELLLTVPAGLAGGATTLKVTTTGDVATAPFYIGPMVTAVTPVSGNGIGGSVASILGAGFTGVDGFVDDPGTAGVDERFDGVTVGGERVTKLVAVSDKEVVVKVPAGTDLAAPVVVSTTDGTTVAASNNSIKFAYQPTPIVTAVSQNWNLVNDPQPVVFTGRNFTSSTVVKVGALDPVSAVVDEVAGTITVTPPAGIKAAVTAITFTNTLNTVPFTATTPFAYIAAPVVAKVLPATGMAGRQSSSVVPASAQARRSRSAPPPRPARSSATCCCVARHPPARARSTSASPTVPAPSPARRSSSTSTARPLRRPWPACRWCRR